MKSQSGNCVSSDNSENIGSFFQWIRKRKKIDLIGDFIGGVILSFFVVPKNTPNLGILGFLFFVICGGILGGLIKANMTYDYEKKKLAKKQKGEGMFSNDFKKTMIILGIVFLVLIIIFTF